MMRRVLVLDAGGFIGRAVVQALAASDWAIPVVTAHDRASSPTSQAVEVLQLDATDPDAMSGALAEVAGVVNCVGGAPEAIVACAKALFSGAARLQAAPRIVQVSTIAAYGSATGIVDEDTPLRGDHGPYSAARVEADRLAAGCATAVRLRPGIVYGPGSVWWSDRIARLLVARRLGTLGSLGEGVCNLVHVNDVARAATVALMTPGVEGHAFNLANPSPPTWNEYFSQYGRALGLPAVQPLSRRKLALELRFLAFPYKIGEIVERRVPGLGIRPAPAIRPWLTDLCRQQITLTSRRAEQQLHLDWLPLADGLRSTARWFLDGGRT